ncbi:glycosyltransferase [Halobacillus litoralis]|uniref:Glycosyltransferase family 1 protein n=1 Tax=Halobacillus litoralis TaxID=45668 RepID=A0A410MFH1_9BACI|nr:glycosyltransferase [Halobacillus litoralis]QAS53448.1 glycosyltransferase family 1 protein [Halobacillus litoralis]
MKRKKVLHIIPNTTFGGTSKLILDIYKKVDKSLIHFDFVSFNKGELHSEFTRYGSNVEYIPYIKETGIIKHIKLIMSIIKKNGPYDAIHVHNGYKASPALFAAKISGINNRITHIHQNKVSSRWIKGLFPILKYFLNLLSTKKVACSKSAGELVYSNSFQVINNSIDLEKYDWSSLTSKADFKKEFDIPNNTLVLGHVGRFSNVKNHEFLINISEYLKSEKVPHKLLLIGKGPLEKSIRELVKKKGLENNVNFLGNRFDVPDLVKNLDVFLLPSYFEGFSIATLEAQVLGVKSIISNNVPKEVDLNANIIKYKKLSDGAESWGREVLGMIKESPLDEWEIKHSLKVKGLDLETTVKEFENLYFRTP